MNFSVFNKAKTLFYEVAPTELSKTFACIVFFMMLLFFSTLLTGCASTQEPDIFIKPIVTEAQQPYPITTSKINWIVLNLDDLKKITQENKPVVIYTLDSTQFSELTVLLNDVNRYIETQNTNIDYYKTLAK